MKISNLIQASIQFWLNLTGRTVDFEKYPFLKGPIATTNTIGEDFYEQLAKQEQLSITHTNHEGLLQEFQKVIDINSSHFQKLDPAITEFYELTATYNMEVWNQWKSPISWFAKILIRLVSVEMKQLNIPTSSLETSLGMSSAIIQLSDATNIKYACWLRKSIKSNKVVYAGFYSSVRRQENAPEYVKVVFPLPKGNVTVLLKVVVLEDGSVKLISDGKRFGETGYYRLHQHKKGVVKARMIPIKEVIHVFQDKEGILRTDHFFKWWKFQFLQLHYKMTKKAI